MFFFQNLSDTSLFKISLKYLQATLNLQFLPSLVCKENHSVNYIWLDNVKTNFSWNFQIVMCFHGFLHFLREIENGQIGQNLTF